MLIDNILHANITVLFLRRYLMNRRILWDCHMHSSFSADSPTPMEDMIRQRSFPRDSRESRLQSILILTTLPLLTVWTSRWIFPLIKEKLFQLQDTYKDKIQIRFGIELGLQMHLADYFHSLMQEFPFDFAIGSSHLVHGFRPLLSGIFPGT